MGETTGCRMVTAVPLNDYIELLKERERLNAVIAYVHAEKFSIDKNVLYALAAREELMEESK